MSPRDEADATRITAYEIVLWIFGAVAVAGAVWGTQWANRALSLANGGYYCDDVGNCVERYDFVLTQTVLALAPPVLVAGLIALIVALAIRAVAVVLRRSTRVVQSSGPTEAADRERFMRPPG